MTKAAAFEPLGGPTAQLGESPAWSDRDQAVWWVDIDGRRLFRTALDGRTDSWPAPEKPGFVQLLGAQVLVGMETGIFGFDPATGGFTRRAAIDLQGQRFNDACLGANGCLWAGTMDLDNRRPVGVLFTFDPATNTLTERMRSFTTINGLAWDDAHRRLYLADTTPSVQTVWTCGLDDAGQPQDREVFARFHDLPGRPDGAMIDPAGAYWVAGVRGGEIYRFAPDGTMLARLAVPVAAPTKPALVPGPRPAMVLTSFADDGIGGRLLIWKDPAFGPLPPQST